MNPLIQSKNALILRLIALTLGCLGLSPTARAVCQEGCLTNFNTALGDDALISNTGFYNTAIGFEALFSNTTGSSNTASGEGALFSNIYGDNNTASGSGALYSNTAGSNNAASGTFALFSNTTGSGNTASGDSALLNNTHGVGNTASGEEALLYNTTGNSNTATGVEALLGNTAGANNTGSGVSALLSNSTGNNNTADGVSALLSNSTGRNNIALGYEAGKNLTTGNYNIDIGNIGVAGEAGVTRLGTEGQQSATYIAGIVTAPLATGTAVAVGITPTGQLGVRASSARFKEAIKPMDKASEAILSLHPVSFRYKKTLDPKGVPQFGLVAEEVAKVDPDLVLPDSNGKPLTVRYDEVNAMLLNEFLKEHRKVEEQGAEIAELRAALARQAGVLQKVSERLESIPSTPRLVENR